MVGAKAPTFLLQVIVRIFPYYLKLMVKINIKYYIDMGGNKLTIYLFHIYL